MGRRLSIDIDGLGDLERALSNVTAGVERGASRAVDAEADDVAADMRAGAPVDTGELVDSISAESDGSEGGVTIGADHWPYVEHGTSTHAAQPFAGPAAEAARGRFASRVESEVRGEL